MVAGVGKEPRGSLRFFPAAVVSVTVNVGEAAVVEEVKRQVGLDRTIEGSQRNALVSASEWVSRVDVSVASDAENGCVGLAGDVSRRLFAHFTDQNPSMARGELVGGVDFGITAGAEKGRVRPAKERGGC
ncbi:hypothetical protein GQ457_08G004370 [Hibiscus cannabinus]